MSDNDTMTTQDVTSLVTATLMHATAQGVPLAEAVNAAISAVAVFASDREGPYCAGARMITAGGALRSPKLLDNHARSLN